MGVGTRVRLHVAVVRAEGFLRAVYGEVFDGVDMLAAAVETVSRTA